MQRFAVKSNRLQSSAPARPGGVSAPPLTATRLARSLLELQFAVGNQTVSRFAQANDDGLDAGRAPPDASRFAHDFSRIPVHATEEGFAACALLVCRSE